MYKIYLNIIYIFEHFRDVLRNINYEDSLKGKNGNYKGRKKMKKILKILHKYMDLHYNI